MIHNSKQIFLSPRFVIHNTNPIRIRDHGFDTYPWIHKTNPRVHNSLIFFMITNKAGGMFDNSLFDNSFGFVWQFKNGLF